MRNLLTALILLMNLSGCVGYTYSRNGEIITGTDLSPVDLRYRSITPDKKADKINPDGTETFRIYDERKWCGLTMWAIIPIPLWLPACHSYTDVTYKEAKPTKVSTQWVSKSGALCGPLIPIMGIDGGSTNFCRTIK